jgi:L-alanine-DL-glutamate epimerase-like enolase superfamily enzyme
MSTYSRLAELPLLVDSYELEGLEQAVSADFVRRTTVIRLHGGGEEGIGEDVTYEVEEQARFQAAGPSLELAGDHTLASFSDLLEGMPDYRRWGFESAALDLALRQRRLSLHEALGRSPRPVTFVVSTALGAERAERLRRVLEHQPGLRFKLDPTSDWDEALVADLAELNCVDVVDFKEAYTWREPDRAADAALYRLVVESLPEALIEDPDLADAEKAAVLEPHRERISWDAVIHSVEDVDALPFAPRTLNSKPSRFGSLRRLFDFYDACAARAIALYGGGQFELGPGRGQIQYLASLFHPEASNDVAPGGYNLVASPEGLPGSPLPPTPETIGFRWLQA